MPFVAAENPKCPKCGKSVYAAEERIAGGQKWHKECFLCSTCKRALDSTLCSEHQGQIYCKTCYGRRFGPTGFRGAGSALEPGKDLTEVVDYITTAEQTVQ